MSSSFADGKERLLWLCDCGEEVLKLEEFRNVTVGVQVVFLDQSEIDAGGEPCFVNPS